MVDIPIKRDRRIARTQQLLSSALMELVVERGYNDITIQDIADRADVSRATFYLHYKDKDDLLFSSMEKTYDGLVLEQMDRIQPDFTTPLAEEAMCEAGDYEHVAEYADFYRVMLSKNGSVGFMLRVMSYLSQVIQPVLEQQAAEEGIEPKVPVDLIAAFCAGAEIGVMKWWLENNLNYTPQEMATMQYMLSAQGLQWALGGGRQLRNKSVLKHLLLPLIATSACLTGLCLCAMLIGRVQARENYSVQRLSVADPLPRLGDLYVSYDVPCSLTLTANTMNVQYPGFAAEIPIPRDVDAMRRTLLAPRAQVTALFFLENQPCDAPLSFPSSRNIYVRWCGFTTLGQYIERCRLPGLILLPS